MIIITMKMLISLTPCLSNSLNRFYFVDLHRLGSICGYVHTEDYLEESRKYDMTKNLHHWCL